MKAVEIRALSADDLQSKLKEARAELFNLRFQMATGQLDNTAVSRKLRRTSLASKPRCAPVR